LVNQSDKQRKRGKTMPDLQLVLWVILPLVLSLVLLLMSSNALRHDYRIIQFQLGLPTLLLLILAIATLVKTLQPMTWPLILPYLVLAVCLPLVLLQRRLAKRHQRSLNAG